MVTKYKPIIRFCSKCGKKFKATSSRNRMCDDCTKKSTERRIKNIKNFWVENKIKGWKNLGICKKCGKIFMKKNPANYYCSPDCHNKSLYDVKTSDSIHYIHLGIRFEVFKRDNFTCQYCGRNVREDGIKLHIDHIIPKSKGGNNNPDNLITSCLECNYGKGSILLEKKKIKNNHKNEDLPMPKL